MKVSKNTERVYSLHDYEEWSLGDFVLSEGTGYTMIDAISRLIPGVLQSDLCRTRFFLVEKTLCSTTPHYTRPDSIKNLAALFYSAETMLKLKNGAYSNHQTNMVKTP